MSIASFVVFIGVAITEIVITNHAPALAQEAAPPPAADSVIRVKSAYDMDETLVRIKKTSSLKACVSLTKSIRRNLQPVRESSCFLQSCQCSATLRLEFSF